MQRNCFCGVSFFFSFLSFFNASFLKTIWCERVSMHKTPRHRPHNGSRERALQNKLGVSAARMKPTMIRLLNNQANSPHCNKHCLWGWSKHRQVWFTCLSKRKNTCNKEPCKTEQLGLWKQSLPYRGWISQARWEAGSAQPSWDAPEERAHSSQTGDNGKTSP